MRLLGLLGDTEVALSNGAFKDNQHFFAVETGAQTADVFQTRSSPQAGGLVYPDFELDARPPRGDINYNSVS